MRIAILDYRVVPNNPIGSCHLKLLAGMAGEHEFTVFAPRFDNPDPSRIRYVRVPVPVRPQFVLFLTYHLMAPLCLLLHRLRTGARFEMVQSVECNTLNHDLVYAHFCHRAFLRGRQPRRGFDVRRWFRWTDHRLRAAVEPRVYRRARHIVVPSEGLAREMAEEFPGVSDRISIIRNPIRSDLGHPTDDFDRAALRAGHGLPPDALVLLFAALGHFERKGLRLLIEALAEVEPSVHALVAGGEPAEIAAYRQAAREAGVAPRVHFLGYQSDMRPWFWVADCFVLPSSYEACPLVALEAASARLPLITTRLNGVAEFAREGVNAFIIDREVSALARAITRLASLSPDSRVRMGAAAAQAVQRYTVGNFVAAWRETFRRMSPGTNRAVPQCGD